MPMDREDGPLVPDVLDQILRRSQQPASTTSRSGGGNRLGQLRSELGSPNERSSEFSSLTSAGGRKVGADNDRYKSLFTRLHEGFGRLLKEPWVKRNAAVTQMKKLEAGEGVCLSSVFWLPTRAQPFLGLIRADVENLLDFPTNLELTDNEKRKLIDDVLEVYEKLREGTSQDPSLKDFYEDSGFFSAAIAYGYLRLLMRRRIQQLNDNLKRINEDYKKGTPEDAKALITTFQEQTTAPSTYKGVVFMQDAAKPSNLFLFEHCLDNVPEENAEEVGKTLDSIVKDLFDVGLYIAAEEFISDSICIARNVFGRRLQKFSTFNTATHPISRILDGDVIKLYGESLTKVLEERGGDESEQILRASLCSDDKYLLERYESTLRRPRIAAASSSTVQKHLD